MPRRPWVAAHAGAMLAAAAFAAPAAAQGGAAGDQQDSFIVVLEDSAGPGKVADALDARAGVSVGHVYRHALRGFSARMPESRAT